MSVYPDTSFYVSLYLPDTHSAKARSEVRRGQTIFLTALHRAEWAHALTQHLFRKEVTAREAARVSRMFERDRTKGVWKEVAMPPGGFERSIDLARRHGARLGVRTLDSLHVGCALELEAERFWTFDARQARLARAAGLPR